MIVGAPLKSRADYRELNFAEIPHKPGRFDVVVGFELIEHLEDANARELLRVMHTQLCVGGRAFLTTPHIDGAYGSINPDPAHILLFDTPMLENMLREELELEPLVRDRGGSLWAAWRKE